MTQHPLRLAAQTTLSALFALTTLMPITAGAQAHSYPNKPVRLLVGFAPGGGVDVTGRIVAQKLSELWGQTMVVDNRAGAGGTIATDIASKVPAGTPKPILAKLNGDLTKVLNLPDTQRRLAEHGVDTSPSTPEQFAAFIKSETDTWARVVRDAKVPQQ